MNPQQHPPPPPRNRRIARLPLAIAACLLSSCLLLPCGPFLPGSTLGEGQQGLLRTPELSFLQELALLLKSTNLNYGWTSPRSNAANTFTADLSDLETALTQITPAITPETQTQLLQNYTAQRNLIQRNLDLEWSLYPDTNLPPRIKGTSPIAPKGLPLEFSLYFDGAVAWHQASLNQARKAWSQLLQLPPKERRYRSTWAAFMLGRSWESTDRPKAIRYFQHTRHLATNGFSDSLHLAQDSLGFEARLHARNSNYPQAINLYLKQIQQHDPQAVTSLHVISQLALLDPQSNLTSLARNPTTRDILTAYVLSLPLPSSYSNRPQRHLDGPVKESLIKAWSHVPRYGANATTMHHYADVADVWLNALLKAKVTDASAADRLALLAYQRNRMDLTDQWLQISSPTPLAQWLQSRLLIRQGKINEAGAILSSLCYAFSTTTDYTSLPPPSPPPHPVYVNKGTFYHVSLHEQALAEWSVLLLARQQYVDALHALILSGYWNDAAYVAERVLTLQELQTYIDAFWPLPPPNTPENTLAAENATAIQIHDLLARRLGRLQLWDEAKPHLRQENQALLRTLQLALNQGHNPALPPITRGRALSLAAKTMRQHGLELVGTETHPDWAIHRGQFDHSPLGQLRATNDLPPLLHATPDELQRNLAHAPANTNRWHYRYLAADLAWEAASLLPNHDDETARILALGGSWLKNLNPQKADAFYKSLVNRCRNTPLGQEADRRRWFPPIDENGNLQPPSTPTGNSEPPPNDTNPDSIN